MPERTVIQWDKDDLDDLGPVKVDVLGLGMLSAIRRAWRWSAARHGRPFALADVRPKIRRRTRCIARADTIGVFPDRVTGADGDAAAFAATQLQRPGDRGRDHPPGPIQGDMVHPYLRRRNGEEPVSYPSAEVRSVPRNARSACRSSRSRSCSSPWCRRVQAGEADRLRRAMAAWKPVADSDRSSAADRGHSARAVTPRRSRARSCNQILGFGEYGFPECVVGANARRWTPTADAGWRSGTSSPDARACNARCLRCAPALAQPQGAGWRWWRAGSSRYFRLRTGRAVMPVVATAAHPFLTRDGLAHARRTQRRGPRCRGAHGLQSPLGPGRGHPTRARSPSHLRPSKSKGDPQFLPTASSSTILTPPASRCWCTCRPGSSATSRRLSPQHSSTASRWALRAGAARA